MAAVAKTGDKWLTTYEAGAELGVCNRTIWNWIAAKKLRAKPFSYGSKRKTWRISPKEMQRVKRRIAQGLPL